MYLNETSKSRFPDFLVIGAAKAGTTALWRALNSHPSIFMSAVKEPGFFAYCGERPSFRCPGSADVLSLLVCDEAAYKNLFAACPDGHKAGEASTFYLDDLNTPANAFLRIPDARLVVILRNPTERAFSNWVYYRQRGIEKYDDFETALSEEPERLKNGWRSGWGYWNKSLYGQHVDRWLSVYPRESLLILFYDDLIKAPVQTLNQISRHIGVSEFGEITIPKENRSFTPRSGVLQRLIMGGNPLRSFARRHFPLWMRDAIMWPMLKANLRLKSKLDATLRKSMSIEFEAEIRRVEEITGRNLDAWRE